MSFEQLFDRSYERVLQHKVADMDFFETFYEKFLASSDEVRAKFAQSNMTTQRKMLKKSFYSLLVFYASNAADDYLNKMVEKHSAKGVNIPDHMYDVWLDCLVATVADFDPVFNHDIELAWRLVMSGGITYMKFKHD